MAITARLTLILKADDVTVAESEDPEIWKAAFEAIQTGLGSGALRKVDEELSEWVPEEERVAIRSFAAELGVDVKDVLAACHPRTMPPYLFLNRRHWEAFKRQTPERGRNAVSNAVLAVTLLLLWAEKISLDRVSQRDGMAVLRAISASDEHASRAVDNCPWLQRSTGRVVINPDEISKAIAVARAFCLQQAPEWPDEKSSPTPSIDE
jgi:hypothetical protein